MSLCRSAITTHVEDGAQEGGRQHEHRWLLGRKPRQELRGIAFGRLRHECDGRARAPGERQFVEGRIEPDRGELRHTITGRQRQIHGLRGGHVRKRAVRDHGSLRMPGRSGGVNQVGRIGDRHRPATQDLLAEQRDHAAGRGQGGRGRLGHPQVLHRVSPDGKHQIASLHGGAHRVARVGPDLGVQQQLEPRELAGAQLLDESWQGDERGTAQLEERRATRLQLAAQFGEALAHEPGAVSARSRTRIEARLPDEDREERAAASARRVDRRDQRGMIVESKISPQPEDRRGPIHSIRPFAQLSCITPPVRPLTAVNRRRRDRQRYQHLCTRLRADRGVQRSVDRVAWPRALRRDRGGAAAERATRRCAARQGSSPSGAVRRRRRPRSTRPPPSARAAAAARTEHRRQGSRRGSRQRATRADYQ